MGEVARFVVEQLWGGEYRPGNRCICTTRERGRFLARSGSPEPEALTITAAIPSSRAATGDRSRSGLN